jgi:hypothetical protein
MPEKPRLDVFGGERLSQQGILPQINHPQGKVIRRPPIGVESAKFRAAEGCDSGFMRTCGVPQSIG